MRSLLLGELEEPSPRVSGRRFRTSSSSRQRFHPPLCPSLPGSLPTHPNHTSFSTAALPNTLPSASFLPKSFLDGRAEEAYAVPLERFIKVFTPLAQSVDNLKALEDTCDQAKSFGTFKVLSTKDAQHVLELFGKQIDSMCLRQFRKSVIMDWGNRMLNAYIDLPKETKEALGQTLERQAFVTRALSFSGQWVEARKGLDFLLAQRKTPETQKLYMDSIQSYLLAKARIQDMYHALAYWGQTFMNFVARPPADSLFGMLVAESQDVPGSLKLMGKEHTPRKKIEAVTEFCLKAAVLHKELDQAVLVVEQMRELDITPVAPHMLELCRHLAVSGRLAKAQEFFAIIPPSEFRFYHQTKLFINARSGNVAEGMAEIEARKKSGQFTNSDASAVLFPTRFDLGALKRDFEHIYPIGTDGKRSPTPSLQIYTNCVQAHANAGDAKGVNWWLQDMENSGIRPDHIFFTVLLKLFKNVRDDQSLLITFRRMLDDGIKLDYVVYIIMMSHFAARKDSKAVDALFVDALNRGVDPDERMYKVLQNAHIQAGNWKEANRIFNHLTSAKSSKIPAPDTYNFMLRGHLTMGASFATMTRLFLQMKKRGLKPDNHTYTIMILSACECNKLDIAMQILEEAKSEQVKTESKLVTEHTMTILLAAHLRHGDKEMARVLLNEMVTMGLQPSSITYGHIIKAYGTSGLEEDLKAAEEFVKGLLSAPEETKQLWNKATTRKQPLEHLYLPLMTASNGRQDVEAVERLYGEFMEAGGKPTISLYHQLLVAYRNGNETEKALELWPMIYDLADRESISHDTLQREDEDNLPVHHLANIQAPLSTYIDLLSQASMHEEVANTWLKLQARGFFFDSQNWNHLVVALLRAAQLERAFEIMEKIFLPNSTIIQANKRLIRQSRKSLPLGGRRAGYKQIDLYKNLVVAQEPGPPLWSAKNRQRLGDNPDKRTAVFNQGQIKHDYAYPMKVLEFVRPGKDVWLANFNVFQTLLAIWMQLERGYSILPLEPRAAFSTDDVALNVGERDPEVVGALITQLREDYPATVDKIESFRYREHRRLRDEAFQQMYVRR